MAITYPIALPSHIPARISIAPESAVGIAESPFTGQTQVQRHAKQRWTAEVEYPLLARSDAETIVAALLKLNGREGTFLMGDPAGATPRGSAALGAAVTNLALWSDAFDNAAWQKTQASVTANAATAPDGSVSADKLVENAAAGVNHWAGQSFGALADNTVYSFQVTAKAAERGWITLQTLDKANVLRISYFDLVNGGIGTNDASHTPTIRRLQAPYAAWYRCAVSTNVAAGATTPLFLITLASANGGQVYNGDGVSGAYLWRAQLVQGNDPGADVFTGATAAARTAGIEVLGAGQTGNELLVHGFAQGAAAALKAGDYLSLGAGSSTRLYRALNDVSSDGLGAALLDLWPRVVTAPAHQAPVVVSGAQGLWRLASDAPSWDVRAPIVYGIRFSAVGEAG